VAKRIGGDTVRMAAYNGSVHGPALRVREGSQFGCDSCNDEIGEPFVERVGKQRFV
jgi:hypothetical protein